MEINFSFHIYITKKCLLAHNLVVRRKSSDLRLCAFLWRLSAFTLISAVILYVLHGCVFLCENHVRCKSPCSQGFHIALFLIDLVRVLFL